MGLKLSLASEADASCIADIHMAAFSSNKMLQAQFPTLSIRDELKKCIAEKALADIRDPKIAVLLVRDEDTIMSFAKWALPIHRSEAYMETPWRWPKGTNLTILNQWIAKVEDAEESILGGEPCYRKSWQTCCHFT